MLLESQIFCSTLGSHHVFIFSFPFLVACINQDIDKSDIVVDSANPSQTDQPEESENNTNENPVDEPEEGFFCLC